MQVEIEEHSPHKIYFCLYEDGDNVDIFVDNINFDRLLWLKCTEIEKSDEPYWKHRILKVTSNQMLIDIHDIIIKHNNNQSVIYESLWNIIDIEDDVITKDTFFQKTKILFELEGG